MRRLLLHGTAIGAISLISARGFCATDFQTSVFDRQIAQIRYENSVFSENELRTAGEDGGGTVGTPKRLSPGRAFAMSLLVPGLGQFYTGSKIKAAGFFALDVTSWVLHFKARSDGNQLTDEFEAFQQVHWSRASYEQKYLYWAYGYTDDDSVPSTYQEVSHHLPDSPTQQYYEMTGKYDQFSWGWDDARLRDSTLDQFGTSVPRVIGNDIPYSANRLAYETMRHNANKKFDAADRWLIISLANRVISAFEAAISARHKNKGSVPAGGFGRVTVRADLRSYAAEYDTPYLRCTYAF